MDSNPFGETSGKLSAEEQAEFDAALAAEQGDTEPDAHAAYPVENGAVRWSDAANGGDTSHGKVKTFSTPWGIRPMDAAEVADLRQQGVECAEVDTAPDTSLADEKSAMSHVVLTHPGDA